MNSFTIHKTIEDKNYTIIRQANNKLFIQEGTSIVEFEPHLNEEYYLTFGDEYIITAGVNDKQIKFWKIQDLIQSNTEPTYQRKNGKKITGLHWVKFKLDEQEITGIVYSDKFGEVRFFNTKYINQDKEESKEGGDENEEKENNANLLFGHQDIISHLEMTPDNKYIVTVDSSKIKITFFPEVVWIHSVTFHMMKSIDSFIAFGEHSYLTFWSKERWLKIWRIQEDKLTTIVDIKDEEFIKLIKDEVSPKDKIKINKIQDDGTVVWTIYKEKQVKVAIFKVDLI